ncbi:MAG TPA: helix-turn-helix domain-containing protein [Nitrosopumilaceae archaeon]|nr:helix-turn-helix domain-containing protein [Nitrosopumilaceae archaeon]
MQDEQQIISPFLSGSDSKLYQYKMKLEQVKTELLKFGLTPNQAKVFIYLGKYGPKTAPEVSKSLEMPRTETYHLINTLQNKGIVRAEFSLPTKYSALSIGDTILTLVNSEQEKIRILTNQKQELAELWNDIPSFIVETSDTKKENMQMLQGTPQIHTKIKELINHTNEELFIFCTEKDLSRFYYADFTELFSNLIADVKIIISPAQIMPQHAKEIDKKKIKIMFNNKNENQCFLIRDSNEVLFFLRNANHPSHNIFAMLADSRSLVDSMHMLFELCWDKSEPVY